MSVIATEVVLRRRPVGEVGHADFDYRTSALPDPTDGQVLVKNLWMSVDPYMRRKMNEDVSYIPPFEVGAPMAGGAVGEVIVSADPSRSVGDYVLHNFGWRSHVVCDASRTLVVDTDVAPLPAYLGVLGMPGLTAHVGLVHIAGLRETDTVFVSGAAGAVGSIAGQIARIRGRRVIGSAGSAEKVAWLQEELGFDAAFNYRDGDVTELLARAAPNGIDVYFDNVGYDHLAAALSCANNGARFAMCGTIADYNSSEPRPGPSNLFEIVARRVTLRGFIVADHMDLRPQFISEMSRSLSDGSIVRRETVMQGLEMAPTALLQMFRGANIGKMLVRLDELDDE